MTHQPTPSHSLDSATVAPSGAPSTPGDTPIGGRYLLLDEIARGGMGAIYRATDTVLDREVAVKVLQDHFQGDHGVARRFLDEARIAGQLQHPGIPAVHDLGTLPDGRPFLAMKLVRGETLERLLKERSDPAAERGRFVAVFEGVCQAVAYAHAHGVIHRDLKPANVMVGAFGEVQVMDWGLAKVLGVRSADAGGDPEATTGTAIRSLRDGDGSETQAGSVLGTPAFMPPEQALGAIGKIDCRSDVFGLGAILAVILTGKPPFQAGSLETVRIQAAQGKVDDCFARLDSSGADPDLVALCKKCLSPERADRPADAGVVAKAVADLRAAADERARQAELERVRAEEQRKRRRVQLTLALAVFGLVAVAGFGIALASLWQRAERAKEAAESAREEAETSQGVAEAARDAEKQAREKFERSENGRTMQVAHQEWRDNNITATLALLGGTRRELRGWEWRYVHRLCHSDLLTLTGHTDVVHSASFSADGTRIVTASFDRTAKVWDAKSGKETLSLTGHTDVVTSASFSADGTRIVTASQDRTARVWDAGSGTEVLRLKGHMGYVSLAAFSGDGTRIVTASGDKTAKVWDTRTGKETLSLKGHTHVVRSAAFSADGTRVVTASYDRTAKVWDTRTGKETLSLTGHTDVVHSAAFSADGARVVTASYDRTAKLWDAGSGTETLSLKGHTGPVLSASFSPDGTRVVTASRDRTAKVWDASPVNRDFLPKEPAPPPKEEQIDVRRP